MKTVTEKDARVFETYQDRPVSSFKASNGQSKVEYKVEYDVFENLAEAQASEDWPSENEILKYVNTKRKTAAVAKSYQEAVAPFKAEFDNSPAKRYKDFIDSVIKATGKTTEEAAALAESLGIAAE